MKELACPYCGWFEHIRVKDRRGIWRRRECMNPECNERFSTHEVVVTSITPRHQPPSPQLALF